MLTFENALSFKDGEEPPVALRNFWAPEESWIWSTGRWCEITFAFEAGAAPPRFAELVIDLDVYKYKDRHPGQNVLVYLNGLRIGSLYCTRRMTVAFAVDPRTLASADNILTLDTPDSARPSQFGGADGRQLGVQLFNLQLRGAV